jgi:hypothetical protein
VREESAQCVLLVRAVEEADREGRLLTRQERAQAAAVARASGDRPVEAIAERRADRLVELLSARAAWVEPVLRGTRFPSGIVWIPLALAGIAGFVTDSLGPERRINILSLPLLGLIFWNLAVYAALLAEVALHLRRRVSQRRIEPATGEPGALARMVARAAEWRARRLLGTRGRAADLAGRAVAAYLGHWRRAVAPLLSARVRLLLHLGAALLAVGVLVGTYARGIAFEYRATWESTFLAARELRAVLVLLLGPASALLGQPIPPADALALMRAPSSGDAAPWIHRYALTTALVVLLPRFVLAARAWARARRLAADLPMDLSAPYFRRLASAGRTLRIDVVPYGVYLGPRETDTLRRALEDFAGGQTQIRIRTPAPYGTEADEVVAAGSPGHDDDAAEQWLAVVFSLAQTPEDDVHGDLLRRLATWTAAGEPGRRRSLVVIDDGPYRERLAGTGAEERRLADRRRAWERVAGPSGTALVHVDLATGDGEATLDRLERAARSGR